MRKNLLALPILSFFGGSLEASAYISPYVVPVTGENRCFFLGGYARKVQGLFHLERKVQGGHGHAHLSPVFLFSSLCIPGTVLGWNPCAENLSTSRFGFQLRRFFFETDRLGQLGKGCIDSMLSCSSFIRSFLESKTNFANFLLKSSKNMTASLGWSAVGLPPYAPYASRGRGASSKEVSLLGMGLSFRLGSYWEWGIELSQGGRFPWTGEQASGVCVASSVSLFLGRRSPSQRREPSWFRWVPKCAAKEEAEVERSLPEEGASLPVVELNPFPSELAGLTDKAFGLDLLPTPTRPSAPTCSSAWSEGPPLEGSELQPQEGGSVLLNPNAPSVGASQETGEGLFGGLIHASPSWPLNASPALYAGPAPLLPGELSPPFSVGPRLQLVEGWPGFLPMASVDSCPESNEGSVPAPIGLQGPRALSEPRPPAPGLNKAPLIVKVGKVLSEATVALIRMDQVPGLKLKDILNQSGELIERQRDRRLGTLPPPTASSGEHAPSSFREGEGFWSRNSLERLTTCIYYSIHEDDELYTKWEQLRLKVVSILHQIEQFRLSEVRTKLPEITAKLEQINRMKLPGLERLSKVTASLVEVERDFSELFFALGGLVTFYLKLENPEQVWSPSETDLWLNFNSFRLSQLNPSGAISDVTSFEALPETIAEALELLTKLQRQRLREVHGDRVQVNAICMQRLQSYFTGPTFSSSGLGKGEGALLQQLISYLEEDMGLVIEKACSIGTPFGGRFSCRWTKSALPMALLCGMTLTRKLDGFISLSKMQLAAYQALSEVMGYSLPLEGRNSRQRAESKMVRDRLRQLLVGILREADALFSSIRCLKKERSFLEAQWKIRTFHLMLEHSNFRELGLDLVKLTQNCFKELPLIDCMFGKADVIPLLGLLSLLGDLQSNPRGVPASSDTADSRGLGGIHRAPKLPLPDPIPSKKEGESRANQRLEPKNSSPSKVGVKNLLQSGAVRSKGVNLPYENHTTTLPVHPVRKVRRRHCSVAPL